tara:strand:- start:10208 stop:10504 length:297 start_codon:yes stop_codon:yes gene_type:complete
MLKIETHHQGDSYFELKNKKGEVLFRSIHFENETTMKNTLSSINTTSNKIKLFERKTTHEGLFQFTLKNNKGQTIGQSENYSSEAGMENGIKNLMNNL